MTKKDKTLSESIKEVIQQYGSDVVKSIRLSNILDDVASFDELPAARPVLRTILKSGYGEKLHNEKKDWKLKVKSHTTEICEKYGFQQDIVEYLLSSIVYGLGFSNIIPNYDLGSKPITKSAKHTSKANTISDLKGELNSQKEEYLRLLDTLLIVPDKASAYYPASALTKLSLVEGKIKILSDALKTNDVNWCKAEKEKILKENYIDTYSLRQKFFIKVAVAIVIIVFSGFYATNYVSSLDDIDRYNQLIHQGDVLMSQGSYNKAVSCYQEAYTNYNAFNSSSYKEDAFKKIDEVSTTLIKGENIENTKLLTALNIVQSELQLNLSSSEKEIAEARMEIIKSKISKQLENGLNTLILNISANKGKLDNEGEKLLNELLLLSPKDYWLNFINNKKDE